MRHVARLHAPARQLLDGAPAVGVVVLAIATLAAGCKAENPFVPAEPPFAVLVPQEADVAVGSRHDLAYFAVGECHQTIDLTNLLVSTAFTAFFVANGRLDAALGLPRAALEGVTVGTDCDPLEYGLQDLLLQGDDAFVVEAETDTTATVRADHPGTTTAVATFEVADGTILSASGTFRAHVADRVEVSLACEPVEHGELAGLSGPDAVAPGLVPASTEIELAYTLFAGDLPLRGYEYFPVETAPLRQVGEMPTGLTFETPAATGTVHLSSSIDASFGFDVEVYDARSIDELRVARLQRAAIWSSTPGPDDVYGVDQNEGLLHLTR